MNFNDRGLTLIHACQSARAVRVVRHFPVNATITGQSSELSARPDERSKAVFFSRLEVTVLEGEGPASRSNLLAGDGQWRAFTPAVILFIALPETKDNSEPG